ncbi:hypothetical protein Geob_1786 [Geotalea daltonii FRC-32]|uniref:Uncharacterized protein n=1 Tax=Geotalea daltonii (strain DSM 22248 / JCM 15807 / FRC-32) TaxID=316067 RepID=B9M6T4_GEODF|nr:hypothetical protein [Geotalea daltonii]ACM20144.1 hypothetical protein Geob_1786 [Geotalea daltonii FRC-32]
MKKGKMIVTMAVVSALGFGGQALANDELEVDVDITKTVEVNKNSNNTLEVDASKNIEVKKEVEVNKTIDSNNTKEIEVNKTVEVKKAEGEAEGKGNAVAVNGSTSDVTDNSKKLEVGDVNIDKSTDNSKNLSVGDVDIDKSSKEVEIEKTENEAQYGSVAAIGGNATKEEVDGDIDNLSGGAVAATTGGTASMTDSFNTDSSINATAEEGAIAVNAAGDADISTTEESYNNHAEDHSAAAYNGDAYAQENFNNTTNSNNQTTTLTVGDVDVEIASSVLNGTVSSNVAPTDAEDVPLTGYNEINDSLESPSGITVLSQNTGFSSLVQQSVNVQVNRP